MMFLLAAGLHLIGQPASDPNIAAALWSRCIDLTASEYASMREPIGDIADAAMGACQPIERQFVRDLTAALQSAGLDPLAAQARAKAELPDIRRQRRQEALAIIALKRQAPAGK